MRCARLLYTACPHVCECVGALCRVLGGFIATDVVRRQVSPFSSSGRCAVDPQTRLGARSNEGWSTAPANYS
jgi:hypothetical protein